LIEENENENDPQPDKDLAYLREMEENMKFLEQKMNILVNSETKRIRSPKKQKEKNEKDEILKNAPEEFNTFTVSSEKIIESPKNNTNNNFDYVKTNEENEATDYKENELEAILPDLKESIKYEKFNIELEKLKNEISYKDLYIEELKKNQEEENIQNQIQYNKQITENRRLIDENEHLKIIIEGIKREISFTRSELLKKDGENSLLTIKLCDVEKIKTDLEKKLYYEQSQLKNFKFEYDNVVKNLNKQKNQIESLLNKIDDFKAETYLLKQENLEGKNKIDLLEKTNLKNNSIFNMNIQKSKELQKRNENLKTSESIVNKNINNTHNNVSYYNNYETENYTTKIPNLSKLNNYRYENEDVYYPSEQKIKDSKNEVIYNEQKLSDLLKQKLLVENDLFKLPERPRTIGEINRKRNTEERLKNLDEEISEIKLTLRKLNGK
jgi:hypothetical protein